ncbi:SPOR domain-containing protein [Flammeovirga agarivorans]|uniref:SPOR domain-containing protein n=1 Tax=Flammeovirga agarivorans TaxID=2726742 RepID=A0A7X8SMK0_9BACT|nr:SPOR domain-containing protein [Flammeovirga agarivorans]NLR92970.1 SPOR domain-containing protein [Flammeovirga agarivorans]
MKLLLRFTLIGLFFGTFACKPSQTTTKASVDLIDTDLSAYMPQPDQEDMTKPSEVEEEVTAGNGIPENYDNDKVDQILADLSSRDLGGISVYRILVYSGSDRARAEGVVYNLKERFGNYEVDLVYDQPNYKVRAGYYFDRLTAYGEHTKIKKKYRQAFVLQEKMDVNEVSRRIKEASSAKEAAEFGVSETDESGE